MKAITHKTHCKKRSLFTVCVQSSSNMIPVFIDMVSVVTINVKWQRDLIPKQIISSFHGLPRFPERQLSTTKKKNPNQFQAAE